MTSHFTPHGTKLDTTDGIGNQESRLVTVNVSYNSITSSGHQRYYEDAQRPTSRRSWDCVPPR